MPFNEKENIKKIKIIIGIINNMINGGYITFGVFEIYQDNIFRDTLSTCFQLINNIKENLNVIYYIDISKITRHNL